MTSHTIPAVRLMRRGFLDWAPNSTQSPEDIRICGWVLGLLENLRTPYDGLFEHGFWLSDTA